MHRTCSWTLWGKLMSQFRSFLVENMCTSLVGCVGVESVHRAWSIHRSIKSHSKTKRTLWTKEPKITYDFLWTKDEHVSCEWNRTLDYARTIANDTYVGIWNCARVRCCCFRIIDDCDSVSWCEILEGKEKCGIGMTFVRKRGTKKHSRRRSGGKNQCVITVTLNCLEIQRAPEKGIYYSGEMIELNQRWYMNRSLHVFDGGVRYTKE